MYQSRALVAQGAQPGAGGARAICHLAWNPKVQHIVATAHAAGSVAVADLKKQKYVMDLADNQGCARRCMWALHALIFHTTEGNARNGLGCMGVSTSLQVQHCCCTSPAVMRRPETVFKVPQC